VVSHAELIRHAKERLEQVIVLQQAGLICRDGDFVPSVHYPPITQYPPCTEGDLFSGYRLPQDELLDIYVHLPFCRQRCTFCHYPGKLGEQREEKERYLKALEKEMDLTMNRLGIGKIKARSILIGGGTPTYLTPEQLNRFLRFFTDRVDLSRCTQFNYDVDPNTLVGDEGIERLRIMRGYGVDRLTIGVQSLDDSVLKLMNRPHDARTAVESIENSRKLGYQINIEFIFGYPGQTIDNWIEVMESAVTLDVDEIQLYRLKVQSYGDLMGNILNIRKKNPATIPSFPETMMMKQIAIDILDEHGFHENLRRVFSRKKEHYSHYAYNQCCMLYDQIGFGLTAFSSLRDRFGLNTQYFDEYYTSIEQGLLPLNRGYIRNAEEQVRWAIILPLKNSDIRKGYFKEVTGFSFDTVFRKKIARLKQYGLIRDTGENVFLTKLGAFIADEVVEEFNANRFIPFRSDAYSEGPLNPYYDNSTEDALGISG
jgi:oxygen-independent coproporphyrinogen-3 oxidase